MQRTRIIKFRSENISSLLGESYPFIIMFSAYIFGVLLASLMLGGNSGLYARADELLSDFCREKGAPLLHQG